MPFPLVPVLLGLGGALLLAKSSGKAKVGTYEFAAVKALQSEDPNAIRVAASGLAPQFPAEAAELKVQADRASSIKLGHQVQEIPRMNLTGVSRSNEEFIARLLNFVKDKMRLEAWADGYERAGLPKAAGMLRAPTLIPTLSTPPEVLSAPKDWQKIVSEALASGNPKIIEGVAVELEKAGLAAEAAALRAALGKLKAGDTMVVTATAPIPAMAATSPGLPALPATVLPVISTAYETRKQHAKDLNVHLQNVKRYQENKALVKAFQTQEALKVDGLYGPKSATAIAKYNLVPATPFYWPKNAAESKTAKATYKALLLSYAAKETDPFMKVAWTQAAGKVV